MTKFQKITKQDLFNITLLSAQAESKEVYIFEKWSLTDLVWEKKAEILRKEFLKNNIIVKQICNNPILPEFSINEQFINEVMSFRYVPKEIFDTEYEVCIFDDTVAIYSSEEMLVIKNKKYSRIQKKLFLNIWAQWQSPVLEFNYKPKDSFYRCFRFNCSGIPIIVWPDLDAKTSFNWMNQGQIEKYIWNIIDHNYKEYEWVSYIIAFIWSMDWEKMLDTWRFTSNYVDERSWPLWDNIIYKEDEKIKNVEVASGSTLIILWHEEKLRRQAWSLDEYLECELPVFPLEIVNWKDFFE